MAEANQPPARWKGGSGLPNRSPARPFAAGVGVSCHRCLGSLVAAAVVGAGWAVTAWVHGAPGSPVDEPAGFQVEPGFRVELVAREPLVVAPVAMAFDEHGRLWVVEMPGFMRDLDATGESEPTGRIRILSDADGDGRMDRATVFASGLILPRAMAIMGRGALVGDSRELRYYEDTDGDGRADRSDSVDPAYAGSGNPEHSANGLLRGIDHWHYSAKSAARFRWQEGRWRRESTEFRGQWGITQDDFGRLYYNFNWSQLHADLLPPGYSLRHSNYAAVASIGVPLTTNQSVHPVGATPAVNRGYLPGVLDAQGRLREFTAACSPFVYRGDQFPTSYVGNLFVCDPAANLIKRNLPTGTTVEPGVKPASEEREFLASEDVRFRPVALGHGPEGALYVADMRRGVIQHRAYMTPYLRTQSVDRQLLHPLEQGRIYRVVHGTGPRALRPVPAVADPAGLVGLLSHPNAWHRETAQRLLSERRATEVLPQLRNLSLTSAHLPGRVLALWLLEDFRDPTPPPLEALLPTAPRALVPIVIRVYESLARLASADRTFPGPGASPAESFAALLTRFGSQLGDEGRLQAVLSMGSTGGPRRARPMLELARPLLHQPWMQDAVLSGLVNVEWDALEALWNDPDGLAPTPARTLLLEAVVAMILNAERPGDIPKLLNLARTSDNAPDARGRSVLSALTFHAANRRGPPIAVPAEPPTLAGLRSSADETLRRRVERISGMLTWPGHSLPATPAPGRRVLTPPEQRLVQMGRQQYVLWCAPCHGADGAGMPALGPPLVGSEWVLGPPERIVRILLHGLEGPVHVRGVRYEPPRILPGMPAVNLVETTNIAAVISYIRRDWDHEAEPVPAMLVGRVRTETMGRETPWTEAELTNLPPFKFDSPSPGTPR